MHRDFTYIDDIVEGIIRLLPKAPDLKPSPGSNASSAFALYNIGNNNPVTLARFITAIETALGKKAVQNLLPMQAGDVSITFADIDALRDAIGFQPSTSIEDGINKFVDWYMARN